MSDYYIVNRYAPINNASVKCSKCKLSFFILKEIFEKKEDVSCPHCKSNLINTSKK